MSTAAQRMALVDPLLTNDVIAHLDAQIASTARLLETVMAQHAAIVARDIDGVVHQVSAFQADPSPSKRERKVDELLTRPTYAAWWTNKLCDITGNTPRNLQMQVNTDKPSKFWYEWIYRRMKEILKTIVETRWGIHFYFQAPCPDFSTGKFEHGDLKSTGGYVVAPPPRRSPGRPRPPVTAGDRHRSGRRHRRAGALHARVRRDPDFGPARGEVRSAPLAEHAPLVRPHLSNCE